MKDGQTVRLRAAPVVTAFVTEFLRHRRQVALLLVLPVFVIEGFGAAMATLPRLPGMEEVPAASGRMFGTLFSTAFLTGLFGVDQSLTSRSADRRLVRCGLSVRELLAFRVTTVLVVSSCIAGYCYAVLLVHVDVAAPVTSFAFLYAGGLIYALIGVLVGALSPDFFEGSLLVLFVADMDAFLGSGLTRAGASNWFLPLYYPNELFRAAVAGDSHDPVALAGLTAYLLALTAATAVASRVALDSSGGDR